MTEKTTTQSYSLRDLSKVWKALICDRPELSRVSDFDRAVLARDYVYHHTGLPLVSGHGDSTWKDSWDLWEVYCSAIVVEKRHLCQGLAIVYAIALRALGIPVRFVFMASNGSTHASVEFLHEGRWLASDPTFNVMFRVDGEFVDYQAVRRAYAEGRKVRPTTNGMELCPQVRFTAGLSGRPCRRCLGAYYITTQELLEILVVRSAVAGGQTFAEISLPENSAGRFGGSLEHPVYAFLSGEVG